MNFYESPEDQRMKKADQILSRMPYQISLEFQNSLINFLSSILEGSKDNVQYTLELNCVSDFDITIHTNDSLDLLTLNTSSPKVYC